MFCAGRQYTSRGTRRKDPSTQHPAPSGIPEAKQVHLLELDCNPTCTHDVSKRSQLLRTLFKMASNDRLNRPQASHTTTVLLFLLILVAFFPGIFNYLWTLPLSLLPSLATKSNPLAPSTPPITDTSDTAAVAPTVTMGSWFQKQITLPAKSRGSYLVTDTIVRELPEIKDYKVGLLNLFVQHTSCALSLNENWDDDVRADMSDALDRIAPEAGPKGQELYRHSAGAYSYEEARNCVLLWVRDGSADICNVLQRVPTTCPPTSSPRSSARLSRYQSEMESWQQVCRQSHLPSNCRLTRTD